MQYSPLDQDYLRKLEHSVLAHSADQYEAALRVLREDPTPLSKPLISYLEQCRAMVDAEIERRRPEVQQQNPGPLHASF